MNLRAPRLAMLTASIGWGMAAAAATPVVTWGKPGVSLADYRADALTCGKAGYYHDVSNTDAVKTLVRASKEIDDLLDQAQNAGSQDQAISSAATAAEVREGAQPERQFHAIGNDLQSATDQCLTAHGYRRFALTRDQAHRLDKLKKGSDERRAYLYGLASDPSVLAAQGYDGTKDAGHLRY